MLHQEPGVNHVFVSAKHGNRFCIRNSHGFTMKRAGKQLDEELYKWC